MSSLRILALASALVLLAGPAAARDLCFSDFAGRVFVIQKVKRLKSSTQTAALTGFVIIPPHASPAPMSGTAIGADGQHVVFGILVHSMAYGGVHLAASVLWNTTTGNASAIFDEDGDGSPDYSTQWTPLDCKTVVTP
jgi:hypothetical protein